MNLAGLAVGGLTLVVALLENWWWRGGGLVLSTMGTTVVWK